MHPFQLISFLRQWVNQKFRRHVSMGYGGKPYCYNVIYTIEQAKKAVERDPKDLSAYLALASGCILTGREREARAAAAEVLKMNPAFSMEQFGRALPFKDKSFVDRSIETWRKAGLK